VPSQRISEAYIASALLGPQVAMEEMEEGERGLSWCREERETGRAAMTARIWNSKASILCSMMGSRRLCSWRLLSKASHANRCAAHPLVQLFFAPPRPCFFAERLCLVLAPALTHACMCRFVCACLLQHLMCAISLSTTPICCSTCMRSDVCEDAWHCIQKLDPCRVRVLSPLWHWRYACCPYSCAIL